MTQVHTIARDSAPTSANGKAIGDKVLIAWNASREARRAVSDASIAQVILGYAIESRSDLRGIG
jgi:hypothetical protein